MHTFRRVGLVAAVLCLFGYEEVRATTVILIVRSTGFILAADSRQTVVTSGGGLLGPQQAQISLTDNACKVIVAPLGAFALAGTVGLDRFNAMDVARPVFAAEKSPIEAMAKLSTHIRSSALGPAAALMYRQQVFGPPLDPLEVVVIGFDQDGPVAVHQAWAIERDPLRVLGGLTAQVIPGQPTVSRPPRNADDAQVYFIGQRARIIRTLETENAEALKNMGDLSKRFYPSEAEAVRLINIEASGSATVGGPVDIIRLSDGKISWHTVKEHCK